MKEITVNIQPLYRIHYKSKWSDRHETVKKSRLENYAQYHKEAKVTVLEELNPEQIPCKIFVTNSTSRPCHWEQEYLINSERELTNEDFEMLRALDTFMNGQINGAVESSKKNDDGTFTYKLLSVCDSSD